jgi:hypothetical protein
MRKEQEQDGNIQKSHVPDESYGDDKLEILLVIET